MGQFEQQVACITGGASGIGRATALKFAKEGANVVLVDCAQEELVRVAEEIRSMGGEALALAADVTSVTECNNVFQRIDQQFGRLDILVLCAGVLDYNRSVLHTDEALWDRTIAINQTGVFLYCREGLKRMERQGAGKIVIVSSMAGVSANAGAAYTASKHAVIALAKNIAIQYAGTGIRCNVVCPGRTDTPMNRSMEYFKQMDHEFMDICGRHTRRLPEKIPAEGQADGILFFASDASRHVNGQWLIVDDGSSKHL